MRPNVLREAVAEGRTAVNAWVSSGSPYAAEVLSHVGYHSVTVDAQHGMFGRDSVVALLQAISTGPAVPMARPSSLDFAEIGWLLDAGAYGIIAPSVDSPALARELVDACRYPPSGRRSFGPSRGLLYGGADYQSAADDTVLPWAMIESAAALDSLDEIAATPGLFGLYVGPNDLALSLGERPGGGIGGVVGEAAHRVVKVARANGLASGLFCADGAEARKWAQAGFNLVTPGNDVSLLRDAATQRLHAIAGDTDVDSDSPTPSSTGGY